MHKCAKESTLRAVRYVPDPNANTSGTLCVAEMQVNIAEKGINYFFVAKRFPAPTSTDGASTSMSAAELAATGSAQETALVTAAATGDSDSESGKSRFELISAPKTIDTGLFLQIAFLPARDPSAPAAAETDSTASSVSLSSKPVVFSGVCKCGSLDVYFVDSPGICRPMEDPVDKKPLALKLPFSQFCFTLGVCDGVCPLLVSHHSYSVIKCVAHVQYCI